MISKKCNVCNEKKPLSEFSKNKSSDDGLAWLCKTCNKILRLKYSRSKKGVAGIIYSSQKKRCKIRKMNPPTYTLLELKEWLNEQINFDKLYNNWVKFEYETTLKPSVDRIDDYKSYTLDNIQLMTWGENRSKSHNDRKTGINHKNQRRVIQSDKTTGEFINIFNSPSLAARELNISFQVIVYCCVTDSKFVGDYNFRYVE